MEGLLSSSTSSATSSLGGGAGPSGSSINITRDLDAWLSTWPNVHAQFRFLVTSLQRRKVHGSLNCAKMTIEVLKYECPVGASIHLACLLPRSDLTPFHSIKSRTVMGTCRWANARELMGIVKRVGRVRSEPLSRLLAIPIASINQPRFGTHRRWWRRSPWSW